MAYLNQLTLPSGSKYNIEGTIYLVVGTQTAATNAWTGSCKLDELKAGVTIGYYLPFAGTSSAATLNLTLADGSTTTGAKNIYFTGTTQVKQQFGAGSLILMYYDGTSWHTNNYINSTYTVPTASTSTPSNITNGTASAGSSSNWSRGDHVHHIDVATGDSSGQVKVAGQNVTVKNINNAAYKDVDTSISAGSTSTKLPTSAAVASFVSQELGNLDALRFKGTLGTGGTVTTLPTDNVKIGDTYRVITAGTYSGMTVEVGDLIIATATTPTWTVAQANIDGAVTGPASSTASNFAAFNDTTGKVIKDSGYTVSSGSTDTSASHVVLCNDSRLSNSRTPTSHTHGNIQNGGTLQTNDITIASGDKLVVTDSSDSNKVARTSVSFDGSTTSKALTQKGTFETFLQSHQTIKQDGITGATVNRFGTCSIAAGTAAKTVSITNGTFSLEAGAKVTVKFTNANTASTPTLAVGGTAAKYIFYNGVKIEGGDAKNLLRGVCEFIYDGTQYHLIGPGIKDTVSVGSASGWSAGTKPSLTVSSKTVLKSVACSNNTVSDTSIAHPVAFSVSNENLTITMGELSTSTESVGSASGWSAGTSPSLTVTSTSVLKPIPNA